MEMHSPTLRVAIGSFSGAGKKQSNQDSHGARVPSGSELTLKGAAMAIADGISTSEVSHIAAQTSVTNFLSDYFCTSEAWSVKTAGCRVISAANSWLYAQSMGSQYSQNLNRGYVCTFSALVMKGRQGHIFHIGDCRIYRVAGKSLEPLTTDHRTVISSKESYLSRAMGFSDKIEIDYSTIQLSRGDVFVLTTDGIHEHVSERFIAETVLQEADLDSAAKLIAETALDNGSSDNLTIQIVKVEDLAERDLSEAFALDDSLPPAPILTVPSEFEGYRIVRDLHANHRSHIYLAVDKVSGEQFALKVPSTELKAEPEHMRRFAMEPWIARRLNSPHVLKAEKERRERNSLYVVMEYVEGQTLRQWMNDNPEPDLEAVREIIEQVVRGLRAFHRKDMLHQDLRPENIMMDKDGTVKIIDFGSVRVAGVVEANPAFDLGEILGTQQYTAPEYFVRFPASKRSDQFSLGVIAYEMLTGRLPYGAKVSRCRTEKDLQALTYVSASSLTNRVPDWVDAALAKVTNPDPNKRYATLSEFSEDLRRPASGFVSDGSLPLMKRDPVRFWKVLCVLQLLLILFLVMGQ